MCLRSDPLLLVMERLSKPGYFSFSSLGFVKSSNVSMTKIYGFGMLFGISSWCFDDNK